MLGFSAGSSRRSFVCAAAWLTASLGGCGSAPTLGIDRPEFARLGHFTSAERDALEPLLTTGVVTLVEFSDENTLPAVLVMSRVAAPVDKIASVIADPSKYSRFVDALSEVTIRERHESSVSFEWSLQAAIFTMRGLNVLTEVEIPGPERRFTVLSTGGDLGTGRFVWRVYPRGENESTLVLAMRVDLRESNYVTRELARAGRTVNRSVNIALCHALLLGVRRESERQVNAPAWVLAPGRGQTPPTAPELDLNSVYGLLSRGDIIVSELDTTGVRQVSVFGRMGLPPDRVIPIMNDPTRFGSFLIEGSAATIRARDERGIHFDWSVNLPIVGTAGSMVLREQGNTIDVEGEGGSFATGKWRFVVGTVAENEASVSALGMFNIGESGWLVNSIVAGNPDLASGLSAATELMIVRAIRTEAWNAAQRAQ